MAVAGLGTTHLEQTKLSEEAKNLLQPLATWLSTLEFERETSEFETLAHAQMREKLRPLLTELGLLNKKYSVIRIPGPDPAEFYNSKGSAYIVPIRIIEGSHPTVSERPLVPGEITYIKSVVRVGSKLDLLFVLD